MNTNTDVILMLKSVTQATAGPQTSGTPKFKATDKKDVSYGYKTPRKSP
jgi:hypothetical protein